MPITGNNKNNHLFPCQHDSVHSRKAGCVLLNHTGASSSCLTGAASTVHLLQTALYISKFDPLAGFLHMLRKLANRAC